MFEKAAKNSEVQFSIIEIKIIKLTKITRPI